MNKDREQGLVAWLLASFPAADAASLLVQELSRMRRGLPTAGRPGPAAAGALPGRTTGSMQWRQQRGETGAGRHLRKRGNCVHTGLQK